MGLEIVIGVSGDIREHTGTRLSVLWHPQAQGKVCVRCHREMGGRRVDTLCQVCMSIAIHSCPDPQIHP